MTKLINVYNCTHVKKHAVTSLKLAISKNKEASGISMVLTVNENMRTKYNNQVLT